MIISIVFNSLFVNSNIATNYGKARNISMDAENKTIACSYTSYVCWVLVSI